ncbi:adenylosuccinate lyase [Flexilinea flocculi]|jgi:adenylosuccinate lyase|uniref:Adenylosuccinate lyase n=1 Tax=Flexilinea flocculi TaxID=1678840 RepID=A0A0S7BV70_9CHLR|nr:adenylosuccinate lyase [Flexilinea flocculi]NMB94352.1 adenylosuccinate lyase [Flexilinea flocculi]GAP40704.1 adenylosuccinate lyase [Flexilinea flocculi]
MDRYESPLGTRYASEKMLWLFSADNRYRTWRKLWTALARAEHNLGLPISADQVAELEAHIDDIDYVVVAKKEQEVRHDVMAHIYAYGLVCPTAKGIIHLGATSCYVTDNADLIIYRDALRWIRDELLTIIESLCLFADRYKSLPTLGFTHLQPAQLVTVGKRACLWLQDLMLDLDELDFVLDSICFLGSRGTTGTEASFLELFEGDQSKIDEMNRQIAAEFDFQRLFGVSGQTYPRKFDSRILNVLSSLSQSCYRFANDLRLLQHMQQIEEPFAEDQVGSSAMAYKRNPILSERVCSLARYVIVDAMNAPLTASTQWFERTLDDSANRRISLPEGFLAVDAILLLMKKIISGLHVNEKMIENSVKNNLPFIATENLLMLAVKKGKDRQVVHEIIRKHSMAATACMKNGEPCDLLERLAGDTNLGISIEEITRTLEPSDYVGRSVDQTETYIRLCLKRIKGS